MKKTVLIISAIFLLAAAFIASPIYRLHSTGNSNGIKQYISTPEAAEPSEAEIPDITVEEPLPKPFEITFSFVGDCMLATDRGGEWEGSFNALAKKVEPSYFLENFIDLFENDDWTVANLENVFTDNTEAPMRNKGYLPAYWYRSSTSNTAILNAGSVEVVSLSNNHSED